jgi:tripeptide aminopeptidase
MDMRSNGKEELDALDVQFKECVKRAVEDENNRWEVERGYEQSALGGFDVSARITADLDLLGDRPVGNQPIDCEIVSVITAAYAERGEQPSYMAHGSTDANIAISLGIPGVTISGGGKAGNAHNTDEWYDPTDGYKGPQRNLLALFALTGLDGVSEPLLSKRDK